MENIFKKILADDPKALAEIKLKLLEGLDIKFDLDEAKNQFWVLDKDDSEKNVDVYKYKDNTGLTHYINVYKDNTNSLDYMNEKEPNSTLSGNINKINNHLKKLKLPTFKNRLTEAKTKSKLASAVLQLLDNDYSYKDAMDKVTKDNKLTPKQRKELSKELDTYI